MNIIVTGGTRGIGRAISQHFLTQGHRVAVTFRRHRKNAEEFLASTDVDGARVVAHQGDVRDRLAMEEMCEKIVAHWGAIDVVVHNAASGVFRPLLESTAHHWEHTTGVNSYGLVTLTQAAFKFFSPNGGAVVAISSLGAHRAFENYGLVGASKAALESLVRQLARELAPQNIRVNAVSAGPVWTGALEKMPDGESLVADFIRRSPLHRAIEPDDIAKAVEFLVHSRMINGAVIPLDGGFSIMS